MDDRSFDRLARLLGEARDRRSGLKALVGGLIGAGTLAALDDPADATRTGRGNGPDTGRKKKRKKCDPACDAGFTCVKGRCACASGVTCAGACCASGQVCRDGACADPRPACLAFGAECKETGRRCCDGLTCASGQDGSFPVTCLRAKGAACDSTAECPFGMSCANGRCLGDGGGSVPTGASCAGGESCAQPGATCTAYTTPGAPGGEYCTLPLRKVCTGNPECTCYNCWYVNDAVQNGGRQGRVAPQKACIQPRGGGCTSDADCAAGLECVNGACSGAAQCVPAGGPCAEGPCCEGSCDGGVCPGGGGGGKQVGDACTVGVDTCPTGSTCTLSADPSRSAEGTKCLLNNGESSASAANCKGNAIGPVGAPDAGKCRTCTVYHTTGNASGSFSALKTALQAAASNPTDATKNPVYVGAGTYDFSQNSSNTISLVTTSATAAVQILACGNGDVTFDGGATVTTAANTVPASGNWTGGKAFLDLDYASNNASDCGYNSFSGCAGFVIDGIDFRNGNNASSGSAAGAIFSAAALSVSNAEITRCKGPVGGISSMNKLTLDTVEVSQCYGNDSTQAGAILAQSDLTAENLTVVYNGADGSAPGGIIGSLTNSRPGYTLSGSITIKNNANNGILTTNSGGEVRCSAVTSPAGSICGNPTVGATGATNCGGNANFAVAGSDCTALCKGGPKDTTANGGVC